MAAEASTPLPVDDVLDALRAALAARNSAVLVAPPGAGKTTRVPLALMDEPWLAGGRILVLEPRRLAARAAAERLAATLPTPEPVGRTVGLRARLATRTGPKARIEVLTEGVFTRLILDDPALDGIGAVLFDEFHERSLDADLGLALALDAQRELRPDLRLLVMSATLDGARVAKLLGDAPVIESHGRSFPVETRYLGRDPARRIEDQMVSAVRTALAAEPGSVLAFLPGQAEIRRTAERLTEAISDPAVRIAPLYGAMDMAAQTLALAPAPAGQRKVVLATSIAETSLTIAGIRIVVDSGLARVPRFEPDAGVSRLETVRVSRAAADQRRGRAGRTEPGVCYRLWSEPETASLLPFAAPEITAADLSGLLLDCAEWGVSDLSRLSWLDSPPAGAVDAARAELVTLGALDDRGQLTATGRSLRRFALPPRLATMLLAGARQGASNEAADIAAVLVERGLGGSEVDIERRLEAYRRDRSRRAVDMRRLAETWAAEARKHAQKTDASAVPSVAAILSAAFPERIAKARGTNGAFLLANGRGARLDPAEPLARARYLVAAEVQGTAAASRILAAATLTETELIATARGRISSEAMLEFDVATASLRGRRVRRLGAIELASEPQPVPADLSSAERLAVEIARLGVARLPWSRAQLQLRDRAAFLAARAGDAAMPALEDASLAETATSWLAPYIIGRTRLADITADDLERALDSLLPWAARRRLDADLPTHFTAPTGNRVAIDYETPAAPAISIRVQELFGLTTHPSIAGGRLPLTLNLLSPSQRPLQVTRDLPGFWSGSWAAVKSEMKGRYPKHPWPDDPARAAPTARAKPRGT